jgi:NSS family neurotransmitter:Na+ symporter
LENKRDSFTSKRGFILACIGSAVGMGNIWLFPARVSAFGGAAFLIPYFICVIAIGYTGVVGEMAFGRAMKNGPLGAFAAASERAGRGRALGSALAMLPVLSSLAMAIGYSVVVGWIIRYFAGSVTGSTLAPTDVGGFSSAFGAVSASNWPFLMAALVVCFAVMAFGIAGGIQKLNSVIMPLFFAMFIGIAVYVATLPGADAGYRFMLNPDWSSLLRPHTWMYALGQAFFSLSLAGNGTLVYGSYLSDDVDIPSSAKYVAVFDTLAGIVAALAIIPAMSAAGQSLTSGGPGLMFIYLPNVFSMLPGGEVICLIFFFAAFLAGISSLVNLFEAPVEALQSRFALSRRAAVGVVGVFGAVVATLISAIVEGWMDFCSVYLCPIGAMLAAVMFFWFCGREFVEDAVSLGRGKRIGSLYYPLGKYLFCGLTLLVLVLGTVFGSIG